MQKSETVPKPFSGTECHENHESTWVFRFGLIALSVFAWPLQKRTSLFSESVIIKLGSRKRDHCPRRSLLRISGKSLRTKTLAEEE
jgi:hypothetical protein